MTLSFQEDKLAWPCKNTNMHYWSYMIDHHYHI
jgi:hypothetical protein